MLARFHPALLFVALSLVCGACAYGYKRAAEAAMSPLNVRAQAEDTRLKGELKALLLQDDSYSSLMLTADVFMGRAFIVGFVDNQEQAQAVMSAAQRMNGLRSVDGYLPVKPADDSTSADLETKAAIKAEILEHAATLVSDRYTVVVLDGVVALLGVVEREEERDEVGQIASSASGVKGVKNFLLVVEPGYGSFRPHLR